MRYVIVESNCWGFNYIILLILKKWRSLLMTLRVLAKICMEFFFFMQTQRCYNVLVQSLAKVMYDRDMFESPYPLSTHIIMPLFIILLFLKYIIITNNYITYTFFLNGFLRAINVINNYLLEIFVCLLDKS